jgi:hypothetical protein
MNLIIVALSRTLSAYCTFSCLPAWKLEVKMTVVVYLSGIRSCGFTDMEKMDYDLLSWPCHVPAEILHFSMSFPCLPAWKQEMENDVLVTLDGCG